MNNKLKKYLDSVFSTYEDSHTHKELKEELFNDLQEKFNDLKNQGYDDETAYRMTIDSIGDISEIIESITANNHEPDRSSFLRRLVRLFDGNPGEVKPRVLRDFSKTDLRNSDFNGVQVHDGMFNCSDLRGSDFKGVQVHDGKFISSDLRGSDFTGSDLTNSSFKTSDLNHVKFDCSDLTGAKFRMSDLRNTTFHKCIFTNTDFTYSDLSGVCFDNESFNGTVFNNSGLKGTSFKNAVFRNVSFKTKVKDTIFDGATMDKLTYAVLKGYKADLTNVTVI